MKLIPSLTIAVLLLSSYASAKTSLNSMCYVLDKNDSKVQGARSEEMFELASVSKVVTAYWALRELGPQYRFKTRVSVTPVAEGLYDVHVHGAKDPFWGRQLTHFLFAELNRLKITKIRELTFDENLGFRWSVVTDFINPANPTPAEIVKAFRNHVTRLRQEYTRTRLEASSAGLSMAKTVSLTVKNIEFLQSSAFVPSAQTQTYVLSSSPLYRYLKEMNNTSNNHVADRLFDFLGGSQEFKNFIAADMNLDSSKIQFVNGSGNSVVVGRKENGALIKEYNRASCETTVRVMIKMDAFLQNLGMRLKDVMAVSGMDASTLRPRYDSISSSMVAKTGTVDPEIVLAGMISTSEGEVYFGIFMDTSGPADWGTARTRIRTKVFELIQKMGGRKTFAYASRPFMPFDKDSTLLLEGPSPATRP